MIVEIVSSPSFPETMGPYSQATRAGQFIFCAGQGGGDPTTGKLVEGGIREQTRQAIRNLQTILEAAGSDLAHVVMVTVLLHDWKYFGGMNEVFEDCFGLKPGEINDPRRALARGRARGDECHCGNQDGLKVIDEPPPEMLDRRTNRWTGAAGRVS